MMYSFAHAQFGSYSFGFLRSVIYIVRGTARLLHATRSTCRSFLPSSAKERTRHVDHFVLQLYIILLSLAKPQE